MAGIKSSCACYLWLKDIPYYFFYAALLSGVLGICKLAKNFPQQSFHTKYGSSVGFTVRCSIYKTILLKTRVSSWQMPPKTNKIVREVGGLIPSRDAMFCFRTFVLSELTIVVVKSAYRHHYVKFGCLSGDYQYLLVLGLLVLLHRSPFLHIPFLHTHFRVCFWQ